MQNDLSKKRCVPCEGGEPTLSKHEVENYLEEVGDEWRIIDLGSKIEREFNFMSFAGAMLFVNNVADIAEREGHHPDIHVHYNKVKLVLWTHKINGLHENDFILAAKINNIKI